MMERGEGRGGRTLAVLLPVAIFVGLAGSLAWVGDDAFIAFRYSRNLAEGAGLRYNPGVEPPVEGYTQLGWVLWIALVERLGLDPVLWSRATGIAAGAALILYTVHVARRRLELGTAGTLGGALFLATSPAMCIWATGGLGTMVFALSVFAATERMLGDAERPRVGAGLALAAVVMLMRADGAFWMALVVALCLGRGLALRSRAHVRAGLALGAAVAVLFAAHTGFRIIYHGDWLPNTARAKVGMSAESLRRGACYLATYLLAVPATAVLLAFAGVGALRRSGWLRVAATMAAATLAYGVLVGGDFMAMGRFYVPAVPFLAVAAALWVDRVARARGATWAAGAAALLIATSTPALFGFHTTPRSLREAVSFRWGGDYQSEREFWEGMDERSRSWQDLGRALAAHTEPDESLVRMAIGAVGYYSRLHMHDRAGLVCREVVEEVPLFEPLRMPSHDRMAPIGFFSELNPTYADAQIAYGDQPRRSFWRGGPVRIIPLRQADGYAEDGFLTLSWFAPQPR